MADYKLPYKDERGYTNIFMSALGGDGANMAAKILFKIGVMELGLDGAYDAKYGSEKSGTPTDVSIRFCEPGTPVRESGPTDHPHILCVFHEDLIEPLELWRGLHPDATVIINTKKSPQNVRNIIRLHSGKIFTLDATHIAKETKSRLNMPMIAMLCYVMNFPQPKAKAVITDTWPRVKEENLAAFDSAIKMSSCDEFKDDGKYPLLPPKSIAYEIGYLNMLNGGAIDALTHSMCGRKSLLAGKVLIPSYNIEFCTGCALCMVTCPDPGALVWKDGKVLAIDINYCKGCLRCVEVCPPSKKGKALTSPSIEMEV